MTVSCPLLPAQALPCSSRSTPWRCFASFPGDPSSPWYPHVHAEYKALPCSSWSTPWRCFASFPGDPSSPWYPHVHAEYTGSTMFFPIHSVTLLCQFSRGSIESLISSCPCRISRLYHVLHDPLRDAALPVFLGLHRVLDILMSMQNIIAKRTGSLFVSYLCSGPRRFQLYHLIGLS